MNIKRAIADAKVEFPDLGVFGFGEHVDEEFDHAQIETAIEFLRLCRKTKQATSVSSYWLKHVAERWGRRNGFEPYVTNGAAIVAALALGFVVKRISRIGSKNPNARIGVYWRDLTQIEEQMRREQIAG